MVLNIMWRYYKKLTFSQTMLLTFTETDTKSSTTRPALSDTKLELEKISTGGGFASGRGYFGCPNRTISGGSPHPICTVTLEFGPIRVGDKKDKF
jgi:hypothetical protein